MDNKHQQKVEIMAPAGSFESLHAAIQGGADSVYFGTGHLNMRSRSSANFSLNDLKTISDICSENNVKSYVTLNTVVFDHELDEVKRILEAVKEHKITAVIASDIAVLEYARKLGIEIHISTQCNVTNIESVRFYSKYADVIVTARELTIKQVSNLIDAIEEQQITGPSGKPVRIELFAHGALCMAVSGKCYLSLDNFNYSANRGACIQPCRRPYIVKDAEEEIELAIDNQYIMSPKDLSTIGFLDKILDAGVSVLKIEGRGRSADYVRKVTEVYKEAVLAIQSGGYSQEKIKTWTEKLSSVYNRGFWNGYYLGQRIGEWADQYGSRATKRKVYVGKITNYFTNLKVAEVKIETRNITVGSNILITGTTTGAIEGYIKEIRIEDKSVTTAQKGVLCSIPFDTFLRRSDKLYIIEDVTNE